MWRYLLFTIVILFSAQPSIAVIDQHLSWDDFGDIDLNLAFRSFYSSNENLYYPKFKNTDLNLALSDYKEKISDDFYIPKELRKNVGFWLKIYTLYSTQQTVIYDRLHPEVVYEVLDFRTLFTQSRSLIAFEVTSKNKIKASLKRYSAAFNLLSLKKDKVAKKLFPEEFKNIKRALLQCTHVHSIKEFKENLRTQTGQRDNIIMGLMAAETYFPKIEEIFENLGVPAELSRLSLVESSFNLKANSSAGASGVWQFIRPTAKLYLKIDDKSKLDERLSPMKSSMAAAELLLSNYNHIGSWTYAVVAYNHGFRAIKKIKGAQVGSVLALCQPKIKSILGWASKNYYSEFLAVLYAEKYSTLFYGEVPISPTSPIAYKAVKIPQSGLKYALDNNIPMHAFQILNPDIRDFKSILPVGFSVAVPSQEADFDILFKRKRVAKEILVRKNRHNPG